MFDKISKAALMRELDGKGVSYQYAHIGQDEGKRAKAPELIKAWCDGVGDGVLCCDGTMRKYKGYGLKRVYQNGERSSFLDLSGRDVACYAYTNACGRRFYVVDCGFCICVYTVSVFR